MGKTQNKTTGTKSQATTQPPQTFEESYMPRTVKLVGHSLAQMYADMVSTAVEREKATPVTDKQAIQLREIGYTEKEIEYLTSRVARELISFKFDKESTMNKQLAVEEQSQAAKLLPVFLDTIERVNAHRGDGNKWTADRTIERLENGEIEKPVSYMLAIIDEARASAKRAEMAGLDVEEELLALEEARQNFEEEREQSTLAYMGGDSDDWN